MYHKIKDVKRNIISDVFKSKHFGTYSLKVLTETVSLDIPNKFCRRKLEIS